MSPDPSADGGLDDRPGRTVVRSGRPSDSAAVAALHARQIPEGFLSLLGPGFLDRLYRRICLVPGCFLLAAEDAGTVVGFIAGSADVGDLYRHFALHDGLHVLATTGPRLVRERRRVLETLRYGRGGDGKSGRGTELLAIAVDPLRRNRGVGSTLIQSFLDQVVLSGGEGAHVVVEASNRTAVDLYERAGFAVVRAFELHAGTTSLLMQWEPKHPRQTPTSVDRAT